MPILLLVLMLSLPVTVMASELPPCPDKLNCVSSQEERGDHYVDAFRYSDDKASAKQRLLRVIQRHARSEVLHDEGDYVKAAFTSLIFRFVDDVEFVIHDDEKRIDVRSASRKGHYDFGVNRRRVERLRAWFGEAL